MLMNYVVIALCTFSGGSAAPAFCDGDPYDPQITIGYYGTLSFNSDPKDGKYPHGTWVTLSCLSGFSVEGPKESECNNGQWEPKLGRCSNGFDCIFTEEQKEWGYSRIINPSIWNNQNQNVVRHADWAYFKCRNDWVDIFNCYEGKWKPKFEKDNRCGCAELKGEGANFSYSPPRNELGRYDPGTSVTISCSGNLKPYGAQNSTCNENKWEPSPATCHKPCDGYPYEKYGQEQSNGQATLNYTNAPYNDGTYSHNTRVTLSCTSGPAVQGSEESVCNDGQWKPKLGRCPKWCYLNALEQNGFRLDTLRLNDGFSVYHEGHSRVKHLEKAQTVCGLSYKAGCCRCTRTDLTNKNITYHGKPNSARYPHNTAVGFTCDSGPVIYGSDKSYCNKWEMDGKTWTMPK